MSKVKFKSVATGFQNLADALSGQEGEVLSTETRDGIDVINVKFPDRDVYGVPTSKFDEVVE